MGDDFEDDAAQYEALKQELQQAEYEESGEGPPEPPAPVQPQYEPEPVPLHAGQQQDYAQDYSQQHQQHYNDDPLGQFEQRIQVVEGHAQEQQFWQHVQHSEEIVRKEVGRDYDDACAHLENGRRQELQRWLPDNNQNAVLAHQYGCRSVGELREALLNRDRILVAQHAFKSGQSPAQLYYKLAQERGYRSKAGLSRSQMAELSQLGITDGEKFDDAWSLLERHGKL